MNATGVNAGAVNAVTVSAIAKNAVAVLTSRTTPHAGLRRNVASARLV